jgi:hypothetical protein
VARIVTVAQQTSTTRDDPMPIDLSTERALTLREAAKLIPSSRKGRPTHISRVVRWITEGSRSADGRVVYLEALRLGGHWITSVEAIQRFGEALALYRSTAASAGKQSGLSGPDPRTATARTTATRRRSAERAARELERIGI